jgi:hypothetical protein
MVHTPANAPPPKHTVTITAGDNGQTWSLSADDFKNAESDEVEIVKGQLVIFNDSKIGVILDVYDEGVHIMGTSRTGFWADGEDTKWFPLYKNNKPAMAKKNIFGFYKKKFWEV